jgi:hypothetical protein
MKLEFRNFESLGYLLYKFRPGMEKWKFCSTNFIIHCLKIHCKSTARSFWQTFSNAFDRKKHCDVESHSLHIRHPFCYVRNVLESWKFAWTSYTSCSIKLDTQIWIFLKFAYEFFWKILRFSWKKVKKIQVRLGRSWRAEILHVQTFLLMF